jgi:hypothetical protein
MQISKGDTAPITIYSTLVPTNTPTTHARANQTPPHQYPQAYQYALGNDHPDANDHASHPPPAIRLRQPPLHRGW